MIVERVIAGAQAEAANPLLDLRLHEGELPFHPTAFARQVAEMLARGLGHLLEPSRRKIRDNIRCGNQQVSGRSSGLPANLPGAGAVYFQADMRFKHRLPIRDGVTVGYLLTEIVKWLRDIGIEDIQSTPSSVSFAHKPRVTLIHRWLPRSLANPARGYPRAGPFEGANWGEVTVEPSEDLVIVRLRVHVYDIFVGTDPFSSNFRMNSLFFTVMIGFLVLIGSLFALWSVALTAFLVILRYAGMRGMIHMNIGEAFVLLIGKLHNEHAPETLWWRRLSRWLGYGNKTHIARPVL